MRTTGLILENLKDTLIPFKRFMSVCGKLLPWLFLCACQIDTLQIHELNLHDLDRSKSYSFITLEDLHVKKMGVFVR